MAKFLLNLLGKTKLSTTPTQSAKPAEQSSSVPDPSAPAQSSSPVTEPSVPKTSAPTTEPVAEPETNVPEPKISKSKSKDKAPATDESTVPSKEQVEKERIRLDSYRIPMSKEVNYVYKYAPVDEKVFLVMPNFANDYTVSDSIKEKFMAHKLMKEEAFSKVPIKKITGVKHVQFEKTEIMYSIYEVLREDGKTQYFCDNDLLSINPSDLIPLGRKMKQKRDEGKHPQDKVAFNRILKCMEALITHRRQIDFQVGCDQHVINLSIAAPNEKLDDIEKYVCGTLLEKPEGAIFRRPGRKCFFRVKDAHRYSNTVVEVVKGYASLQMEKGSLEEKILAEKIFKKLDNLQKLRFLSEQFHKIVTLQPDSPY